MIREFKFPYIRLNRLPLLAYEFGFIKKYDIIEYSKSFFANPWRNGISFYKELHNQEGSFAELNAEALLSCEGKTPWLLETPTVEWFQKIGFHCINVRKFKNDRRNNYA